MRTLLLLAAAAAIAGCGDDTQAGQGGAGGAASTATGTTSASTTTSTTSSQGGGGAAPVCTNAEPGPDVEIVLRNDTSQRIWLRKGGSPDGPDLFDVEGQSTPVCPCIGSNFCKSSGASSEWSDYVGFLDPGAEHTLPWPAVLYQNAAAGCGFEGECTTCGAGACQLGVVPLPRSLTVVGFAFADDTCDGCECDASTDDFCEFTFDGGGPVLQEPIEATATLAYPDATSVVVAFQD